MSHLLLTSDLVSVPVFALYFGFSKLKKERLELPVSSSSIWADDLKSALETGGFFSDPSVQL